MLNPFKKKQFSSSTSMILAGVMLTTLSVWIWLLNPSYLTTLSNRCYDLFLKKHHISEKSDVPVIVDIDEKSLERYGQWPWPRYRLASLLTAINRSAPLAIGLNILCGEPDRTSPGRLQAVLKDELGIDVQFSGLPDYLMNHDQMMADALGNTDSVLGFYCRFDKVQTSHDDPFPIYLGNSSFCILHSSGNSVAQGYDAFSHDDTVESLFRATGVVAPIEILMRSAKSCGFINTMPDSDGVLRRTPMLIEHDGTLHPSLSLALLQIVRKDDFMAFHKSSTGIDTIFLGSSSENRLVIPLNSFGTLLMHFRGPGKSYPYYCAADILDKKISPDSFKDKIVLIGSSASTLKDIHMSPFGPQLIGVEVHAAVIDTVLTGNFIQHPPWGRVVELLILLGAGFVITLVLSKGRMLSAMVVLIVMGGVIYFATELCFMGWSIFVSPVFPLIAMVIHFFILMLIKFLSTERDKVLLKAAFSKFISKPIVDRVISSPHTLKLQGEEKEISIMFVDIRNFTSLSEKLTPEQVTHLLQEYFTPMTRVIIQNNGTLDKFIGDGIMAFWNAPLNIKNHKGWAVQSGVDMLTELGSLNGKFIKKYGFEINMGIGLHTGVVRVGNMGTEELFNYTIIGDDVNVAARLESLSKFYGVRIIISEVLKAHLPSTHWSQELDLVRVKGRAQPLKIYGLYTGKFLRHPKEHLDRYHDALYLYRSKKFQAAHEIFSKFRDEMYDRPLYKIYQERCSFFMKYPPPDNWNGVFSHKNK